MLFDGKAIQVELVDNIAYFTFNFKESGANVIGSLATGELSEALAKIKSSSAEGVLYKSSKEHFIFGADITEFMGHFKKSHDELKSWILVMHDLMNGYEDLNPYCCSH